MSIKPQDFRDGKPEPWEYLETAAIANCQIGTALIFEDGKLTVATGSRKPTYISMYAGEVEDGDRIPVIRVHGETRFVTQFSTDAGGLKVGDTVTLDATGTMATATTTGGVLEIVQIYGTEAGDDVLVRIP